MVGRLTLDQLIGVRLPVPQMANSLFLEFESRISPKKGVERWPSGRRHPLAKRFLVERWDGSSNLPLSVHSSKD